MSTTTTAATDVAVEDAPLDGACGTCGLSVHLLPREAWLKPDLPTYSHTRAASRDADHIATCVPLG